MTMLRSTACRACSGMTRALQRTFSMDAAVVVPRKCVAYRLGLVEYETAWDWQKELIQRRITASREEKPLDHDTVLLLEHPSVYTLGRGATMDNVKFDPKVDELKLIRVDRGGEVTYHGPGQLVCYPILDLNFHKKDLHWYLRQVEELVIQTLAQFDIEGQRVDGLTGVWVEEGGELKKIAAVGTHATRWITMHGFAINTTTDLRAFDRIIPCGIDDRAVTSVERLRPDVTLEQVELAAVEALRKVFAVDITTMKSSSPL